MGTVIEEFMLFFYGLLLLTSLLIMDNNSWLVIFELLVFLTTMQIEILYCLLPLPVLKEII